MKFVCEQQALAKALSTAQKAVSTRTTLPILRGILLDVKNDTLTLSATDLDLSIVKSMPCRVQSEGSIVLTSRIFGDIIRKLPAGEILMELSEEGNMIIKNNFSEFSIIGIPRDDFPNIIEKDDAFFETSVNRSEFSEMIRKTAFAASLDETKGIIVGSLIEFEKDRINMVALDGFRMSIARMNKENKDERSIVVSARLLSEISRVLSESAEENVKLTVSDKKLSFLLENTKVSVRLIDGEYIKYREILPKEQKCVITVGKNELFSCIERASLFAKEGKNNLIRIKTGATLMTISSRSDEGNVKEELSVEREGLDLEIGFNSKYIMDVLKTIDDEKIKIEFNTNVSPCMIKPCSGDNYEHLVLPVRI